MTPEPVPATDVGSPSTVEARRVAVLPWTALAAWSLLRADAFGG